MQEIESEVFKKFLEVRLKGEQSLCDLAKFQTELLNNSHTLISILVKMKYLDFSNERLLKYLQTVIDDLSR